jgi:HK97 family phage major capsid protein
MSMTISIDNLRKALRDTNAKAAVAFADAEKLKDGMIAAGVDPTEGEQFEKVDAAYKGYSILADESAQIEAKLNRLLEIEGLSGKAPAGEPKRPIAGEPERKGGDTLVLGGRGRAADRLLASEPYRQLKASGILEMSDARVATAPVKVLERTEFKTLITGLADTQAGAFILADRQTELLELLRRPRVVAGLVNVGDTDSDMIEYVEQTSRTNNAAETAEATSSADGAAPESGVAFAVRQVLVQEIKHFIPATKRAIADAGQVRAIIESELVEGVLERLDGQLLSGNGSAPNLRGIYNTSGISTQAKGSDSRPDAVHKAFTLIRIANLQPDTLGLHPNDAQDLRLEKDANGAYLFGPPSQAGGDQVWGVPMVANVAFTDGTPLAGAYRRGASLWIREGVSMSMTDAHSDWFIRGIVALLASMRAGFAVPRPAAFCTITGF